MPLPCVSELRKQRASSVDSPEPLFSIQPTRRSASLVRQRKRSSFVTTSTAAVIFRRRNVFGSRGLRRATPGTSGTSQLQPVKRPLVSKGKPRRPLELLLL